MRARFVALLLIVGLVAGGCVAQSNRRGGVRFVGPAPAIVGGAILAGAGGAVIYGVNSDSSNGQGTVHLFDEIGGAMIVVGAIAIIYGIVLAAQYAGPRAYAPPAR